MPDADPNSAITAGPYNYDAVVVGASLAGCATAILLGRAGVRVALVEKQPDPAAFKRICSHSIQASAVPTLERLGLLAPIEAAGGVRRGSMPGRPGAGSKRPAGRPATRSTCGARCWTHWCGRRRRRRRASS